ncbi:MAG: T9SS type A sorting domain-containing protein [Bacteroidota bacterium]
MLNKISLFVIALLFSCCTNSNAQYVTIPDTNFVSWLNSNGYSGCMNGNQMDTTCTQILNTDSIDFSYTNITDLTGINYFDNLICLNCHSSQITTIPALPSLLTYFDCNFTKLTTLPSLPPLLNYLDCSLNTLTSLPALPSSLTFLNCWNAHLNSLPPLPASLITLEITFNYITIIPSLPLSLTILNCAVNQLSSLPTLPNNLEILNCSSNYLTSLPTLPASLINLDCHSNQLTSIPTLPNSLESFASSGNPLNFLPNLPAALLSLACSWNQLTSLPTLPNSLNNLNCSNNQLTTLPAIPSSLQYLDCSFNNLITFPLLQPSSFLHTVDCDNNYLTTFPTLPLYLRNISLNNNHLTSLQFLHKFMDGLYLNNNPDLTCLPPDSFIAVFYWNTTAITCFPNTLSVDFSSPAVNNVPICNLFNTNNCDIYYNIKGNIYNDVNSDCLKDTSETSYRNIKMKLYSNGNLIQQTYTSGLGEYTFDTDTGSYIYAPDTNSSYTIVCPPTGIQSSNLTVLDSINYDMDFAIICKPGFDVGTTSIISTGGGFLPGLLSSVYISCGDLSKQFGLDCASGVSGEVKILLTGPISFINQLPGALTPSVNGDTLIYSIVDFGTVDFNSGFGIKVLVDSTAQQLQHVCFEVWVTPTIGDNDSANNHLTQCFNVVNSYDPNDKEANPEYIEDSNGEWLTYTIRFQNTGNAPARNIYILDTLSQFVDVSSFQLLNYSHEPLIQIMGSKIRFNFANINLPDSTSNEPGSHGYIQYKVKSKPGLAINTSIENIAFIYFDFNAPVVTNTATSIVHCAGNVIINTTQNGNILNVLTPGIYQWMNCNDNMIIPGQTSSSFTPTTNGNYAVIVTNGNCADTSSCINFVISGITESNHQNILLTPNPATENILLENLPEEKCTILFHDITGRVVLKMDGERPSQPFNISSFSKGVYLIEVSNKNVYERLYFVKQ